MFICVLFLSNCVNPIVFALGTMVPLNYFLFVEPLRWQYERQQEARSSFERASCCPITCDRSNMHQPGLAIKVKLPTATNYRLYELSRVRRGK